MNRMEKGKRNLIILSLIMSALSIGLIVLSVFLIIWGARGISAGSGLGLRIIEILGGALLIVLSLSVLSVSVLFLITGKSLKATKGSIKEDNLAKGTVNVVLCEKCGKELSPDAQFCTKCGESVSSRVTCRHCSAVCEKDGTFCPKCGKAL